MKNLFLFGSLIFLGSCGRDEIITPTPSNQYTDSTNCACGNIIELGVDRPMADTMPTWSPTDYWVLVENHCSQNTRRFSISQDQVIELSGDSIACFFRRW
jgi:hypothetical protein